MGFKACSVLFLPTALQWGSTGALGGTSHALSVLPLQGVAESEEGKDWVLPLGKILSPSLGRRALAPPWPEHLSCVPSSPAERVVCVFARAFSSAPEDRCLVLSPAYPYISKKAPHLLLLHGRRTRGLQGCFRFQSLLPPWCLAQPRVLRSHVGSGHGAGTVVAGPGSPSVAAGLPKCAVALPSTLCSPLSITSSSRPAGQKPWPPGPGSCLIFSLLLSTLAPGLLYRMLVLPLISHVRSVRAPCNECM